MNKGFPLPDRIDEVAKFICKISKLFSHLIIFFLSEKFLTKIGFSISNKFFSFIPNFFKFFNSEPCIRVIFNSSFDFDTKMKITKRIQFVFFRCYLLILVFKAKS